MKEFFFRCRGKIKLNNRIRVKLTCFQWHRIKFNCLFDLGVNFLYNLTQRVNGSGVCSLLVVKPSFGKGIEEFPWHKP